MNLSDSCGRNALSYDNGVVPLVSLDMKDVPMLPVGDWPIDVESLAKGDDIDEASLVAIIGLRPSDPGYDHGVLVVRNKIDQALKRLGRVYTYERKGNTLRVLTDSEALYYNERRATGHRRGVRDCEGRLSSIDRNHLSPEQNRYLDRVHLIVSTYRVAGEAAMRTEVGHFNYRRNTPGLLRMPEAG
jgi:hypothetical protein